jgi:predicted nuclease of restriction endonuclease-like (RecB) superfamily
MKQITKEADYRQAVETIKTAILQSQYSTVRAANANQLSLYYGVGKYVSLNSRKGFWGTNAIETISERLQRELPGLRGFSARSMRNMRQFYEEWSKGINLAATAAKTEISKLAAMAAELMNEDFEEIRTNMLLPSNSITVVSDLDLQEFLGLSFTHHIEILNKTTNIEERLFYIHHSIRNQWSKNTLRTMLKEDVYKKQGALPNNFTNTIPDSRQALKAIMMFKDEYLLDYVNLEELGERDAQDIDERVVEKSIIHNIKKFIMTFGQDFTFVGNQYHLEIYGEEFFPDLLFFNRELNALVVVELKTGDFKPSYIGQLCTYLRIMDDKVRKPHENPSIGIVLCKSANKEFVEYVIQDYDKPMGVATYKTSAEMPEKLRKALPDIEELKKML